VYYYIVLLMIILTGAFNFIIIIGGVLCKVAHLHSKPNRLPSLLMHKLARYITLAGLLTSWDRA